MAIKDNETVPRPSVGQSVSRSVCQLVSQAVGRSVIQSASEILIRNVEPSLHETVQYLLKGRSVSQIISNYVSPFFF